MNAFTKTMLLIGAAGVGLVAVVRSMRAGAAPASAPLPSTALPRPRVATNPAPTPPPGGGFSQTARDVAAAVKTAGELQAFISNLPIWGSDDDGGGDWDPPALGYT